MSVLAKNMDKGILDKSIIRSELFCAIVSGPYLLRASDSLRPDAVVNSAGAAT